MLEIECADGFVSSLLLDFGAIIRNLVLDKEDVQYDKEV